MQRFLRHALDLNNLRKAIGFGVFWRAIKSNLRLQILDSPQNLLAPTTDRLKILVLSPHPDDDVFACGGSLAKHARAGDKITIVYLCDGSKGTPEGIRDSSLVVKRKREAEEAARILDIEEVIFWGYKDGRLEANRISIKAASSLLKEIKPDIVYLPSFLDNHPDHRTSGEIFYRSVLQLEKDDYDRWPLVLMYEQWTPLFPNRLIDISDMIETKKQAVLAHQSQLKSRAYDQAILALNKYRAEMNGIKGYAEAFFACRVEIFKKLFELLR